MIKEILDDLHQVKLKAKGANLIRVTDAITYCQNRIMEVIDGKYKGKIENWADSVEMSCCIEYGIQTNEIRQRCRKSDIVKARQMACYIMADSGMRLRDIGLRFFTNADHSTVIHSKKKIAGYLEHDPMVRSELSRIMDRVKGIEIEETEEEAPVIDSMEFMRLCDIMDVTDRDVRGTKQTADIVAARRVLAYFMRKDLDMTASDIAVLMGTSKQNIHKVINVATEELETSSLLSFELKELRNEYNNQPTVCA